MRSNALPRSARVILIIGLILLGLTAWGSGQVNQPISFNHLLHTQELEIECTTCHQYVERKEFAGNPRVEICAECHEEALSESPREARLLEYVRSGEEIAWQQLYRIPRHVYYSHRRHVVMANIECSVCHGEIALTTSSPDEPMNRLSMDFCMDCHEQEGATTDCNHCHR